MYFVPFFKMARMPLRQRHTGGMIVGLQLCPFFCLNYLNLMTIAEACDEDDSDASSPWRSGTTINVLSTLGGTLYLLRVLLASQMADDSLNVAYGTCSFAPLNLFLSKKKERL